MLPLYRGRRIFASALCASSELQAFGAVGKLSLRSPEGAAAIRLLKQKAWFKGTKLFVYVKPLAEPVVHKSLSDKEMNRTGWKPVSPPLSGEVSLDERQETEG